MNDGFITNHLHSKDLSDFRTADTRRNSVVYKNLHTRIKGSGKVTQFHKLAMAVLADDTAPWGRDDTGTAYKKILLVSASRPGIALIVACYCDVYLADRSGLYCCSRGPPLTARPELIAKNLNGKIPLESDEKPTIVISTVGVAATGINGLEAANWCVFFDVPFDESIVLQGLGRINR